MPVAGVPLSTPEENVTPLGSGPDSVMVGAGVPTELTVKDPGVPIAKAALPALVMSGLAPTVTASVTEMSSESTSVTLRMAVALTDPDVAMMVVVPAATAVASPCVPA